MTRSKKSGLIIALLLVFGVIAQAGCASGGIKKPIIFADKANNIPADILSQFVYRYERFITGNERKEFNKILTDEGRQAFIDKFWLQLFLNLRNDRSEKHSLHLDKEGH